MNCPYVFLLKMNSLKQKMAKHYMSKTYFITSGAKPFFTLTIGSRYSRMDQVKLVEDSL